MRCPTSLMALVASGLSVVEGVVIHSRALPGVKVTYQETTICETTPGVKGYSGYVTLPASLDPAIPFESNMFFWFFESRKSPTTAPITLWLQGGPGSASIDQAVSGHNGPCSVNADSKTTTLNPNSWNTVSNMIYIDQPVQTGFSHDGVLKEGVLDTQTGDINVTNPANPTNWLTVKGTFPSGDQTRLVNTTSTAARAIYHAMTAFFDEFPQYHRDKINVWSQSYGGHYAPAIASLINQEQAKPGSVLGTSSKKIKRATTSFGVDSIGIINGWVDHLTQAPFLMTYNNNNSYGIKSYSDDVAKNLSAQFNAAGGCMDLSKQCRQLIVDKDAAGFATDPDVVNTCYSASIACLTVIGENDAASGRNTFDLAQVLPLGFPYPYEVGYLNEPSVMSALGVKLNYTRSNNAATNYVLGSGDLIRPYNDVVGQLLDQGVKVALVYGDRDWRCNWVSGEAVSLSVKYNDSSKFSAAGYTDVKVGNGVAGKVRQHGLFSFTRVYNAGHEVPIYKPAEALAIFTRTIQGKDVATGESDAAGFTSSGPSSVFDVTVKADPIPAPLCYVLDVPINQRCTADQISALGNGTAVVKDYIVS
ncbi:hypothetical protein MCOR25_009998 [Pyricularia grisea]|uniref:Carboxypeptidase S1 n=1 Tax=Pyricularia grisea TaxID=148305 RepID=A0A6P8B3Q6_PYRGI|nr:uncharacterized protein PgNI_06926 [Pyricularia grisea]KAI6351332.1 hypothetical protein MCOR25_009998 [Pyricularia grisea]TLD09328.1 hypothetical protein PgNI_06926 [Pyricularia grisea]